MQSQKKTETIAAIATPSGEGGVGIVRISGSSALEVAKKIFSPCSGLSKYEHLQLNYGKITPPNKKTTIDNGYLVYIKDPNSYTGEDIVELQTHGGSLVLSSVLSAVFEAGARSAEPGEFTQRAFLNGKISITEAEAVSELITAKTEDALKSAKERLDGALTKKINNIKKELVKLLTQVEAELDFAEDEPEDEIVQLASIEAKVILEKLQEKIITLIDSYKEGRALKEGVSVVILGEPNAGKSSLLNILLKEERAIVTEVAGTTRDFIEEVVKIKGLPVRLMDTAGLRASTSKVESQGVERARERAKKADLILYIADVTKKDFNQDVEELKNIRTVEDEKKIIVLLNKCDLEPEENKTEVIKYFKEFPFCKISVKKERGIKKLEELIYEEIVERKGGQTESSQGCLVASAWQVEALREASLEISSAIETLKNNEPREVLAAKLHSVLYYVGELAGETTPEDILEQIFSSFCIGK